MQALVPNLAFGIEQRTQHGRGEVPQVEYFDGPVSGLHFCSDEVRRNRRSATRARRQASDFRVSFLKMRRCGTQIDYCVAGESAGAGKLVGSTGAETSG